MAEEMIEIDGEMIPLKTVLAGVEEFVEQIREDGERGILPDKEVATLFAQLYARVTEKE